MQIEIVRNPDGVEEYMIIEFQGTIDSSGQPLENEVLDFQAISHGEQTILKLCCSLDIICSRERQTPGEDPESQHSSMLIDAIIRRKLVFRNRPKPLVTQQQVAAN
ncbi:unnamed protein product [Nippostrongylus brasiliensis]|uniref:Transposase n=1 Tax=Nippostrongylus brasiliensis TaxID=27835 RepID=A0A158QWT2_NIPBR|nr:unnamed protein product [Nippostrongylus brasiliensis]